MYRNRSRQIMMSDDFFLPFGGKLNPDNRWVKMAQLIPWWEFEDRYARYFKRSNKGEEALSVRVALGSLIIQTRMNFTDRELVDQIMENPYLQYFLGYERFDDRTPLFDSSMLVHFRKRLNKDILLEVNERIAKEAAEASMPEKSKDDDSNDGGNGEFGQDSANQDSIGEAEAESDEAEDHENPTKLETENKGMLILDATCAPSDIRYPTDLRLLNEAREKLEKMIDALHTPDIGLKTKPRTYREEARKAYLSVEKQRKKRKKTIQKAIKKQLGYVRRNLDTVMTYLSDSDRKQLLTNRQQRELETIQKLYDQQFYMYKNNVHSVDDRIVSISQPHIRPIVRGKAGADVEFGNKVMTSVVNGYSFIEKMSFDSFNEGVSLTDAVENYWNRFGYYPEAVLADTIFRNQENRRYLKSKGIRMSGPSLGRPSKSRAVEKAKKLLEYLDSGIRNGVESTYGVGKRRYGLNLIKAKLKETAESCIVLQFLVMNLERRLRVLLRQIYESSINISCKIHLLGMVSVA